MPASKGLDMIMKFETSLQGAAVVTEENIPDDVIAINSRFTLAEIKSGAETDFTLRLPTPADGNENNKSIFSPLGSAVVGCRVGDVIECEDSGGAKKYIIKSIKNCMTEKAA
jgi:regulator of nucleoside diphosphate kinase